MKKYVAEFIGTFALVFIGAGIGTIDGMLMGSIGLLAVALAHGLILMAMVYALGHVSGAHFNPAITAAMAATKRLGLADSALYVISQLLGSAVAALLLVVIFSGIAGPQFENSMLYGFPATMPVFPAALVEAVLTFFLVFVVFGVAVDGRAQKAVSGAAIGLTLSAGILFGGVITGGALNPARVFGPALAGGMLGSADMYLVYFAGPLAGGLLAGLLYERVLLEKRK